MFAICKPTAYEVESYLKVFLFAPSLLTNDDVLVNSVSTFKLMQKCLRLSCNCVKFCRTVISISTGPVPSVCLQAKRGNLKRVKGYD